MIIYSPINGMISQYGWSMFDSHPHPWVLIGVLGSITAAVLVSGYVRTMGRDA
jgi:hypothetical protein